MSLLLNMLSRLVITFLPRSKRLLISRLQSPSTVILEPKKIFKSVPVFIVSPSICHEVMGPDAMIYDFECWLLSQLFHSPLSLLSRGSLVPLGRYIPKYFILFVAMVNEIVSLISPSIFSLLVYRNARDFCVLILYPVTLL